MLLPAFLGRPVWLLLLLAAAVRAQVPGGTLRKDLKRDFGAVGDGRTNDLAAFQRAADFFNQRARTPAGSGRAVLRIPPGTYQLGRAGQQPTDALHLQNCRNLAIVGADSATTEIRYADSLRFGAFDPATHLPYEAPTAFFTNYAYAAGVGTIVVLQNCDNVQVANLALNGNSAHLVVGGHWGDTGIQLGSDGIFVSNSRHVHLRNLAVHHFGHDGIQVLNRLAKTVDDPAQEDIVLENSRFDYNGRQGLSITGANGLRATNCSFSHTGRVFIPALGKPLYSNPGAGVDLEPEGGFVANVVLDRCRFVDNAGQGIVSDRYGDGPPTTKNILIKNSLLWGVTNWSAWVRQTDFRFEHCRIYGAFVTGCAQTAYATQFVGCTFADQPYHGQPAYGTFLLYSRQEARAMRFTRCRFVAAHGALLLAVPAAPDSVSRFQLRDCTFVADQATAPLGAASELAGAELSGTTTFAAGPHHPDSVRTKLVLGADGPGAVVVRPGSRLLLQVPGSYYQLPNGLRLGRAAHVVVGSGCTLALGGQPGQRPKLDIGPRARLVVRKGGTLEIPAAASVVLAGQLVVEDGAHLRQQSPTAVQLVGKGRMRVAASAAQAIKRAGR